jgi:hypothetical protein
MLTSQHAKTRCQQRAIPAILIDLLLQFGTNQPAGGGASKFFFDKAARRRIKAYAGQLAGFLNEHLDVYAIVGADNTIITAAHRLKRIQRH